MSSEPSIDDAIASAVQVDGAMVTRWVLVAEILDADGDDALVTRTSPRLSEWDMLGLLGFAGERTRARVFELRSLEDDEDD